MSSSPVLHLKSPTLGSESASCLSKNTSSAWTWLWGISVPQVTFRNLALSSDHLCHFQFSSAASDYLQPHGLQHARLPLLKLMCMELVMPSNHLILCCPLLLPPLIFPGIWVFSNESVLCIKWPKYWSFSITPSSEYSGLISFTMDWLDLLAVQGTLKSLLQHHSSKASVLQCSAFFFIVQHSHPYMTTGKT